MSFRLAFDSRNMYADDIPSRFSFGQLWSAALQRYEQETGTKLSKLAIAKDFPPRPSSADEIIAILAAQSRSFEAFRNRGKGVLRVLKPIVHFVCLFMDAGAEAGSVSVHVYFRRRAQLLNDR